MRIFSGIFFGILAVLAFALACHTQDRGGQTRDEDQIVEKIDSPLPFSKGVNFSAWFEARSAQTIIFTAYTEQDFINAKSMGIEIIRLPIRLHDMTGGAPEYRLEPLFLRFLDQAVEWAEKHEIYLILDNHSFDPVAPTATDIGKILIPVWTQIAERYKSRGGYILYEILNEPHGIDAKLWDAIQGRVIAAIREIDSVHSVIAGGVNYNSLDELFNVSAYQYDNIIYTFHFYDPYLFTHQGETWGSPPNLKNLKGLPFPADSQVARKMPAVPSDLKGTWIERALKDSYKKDAAVSALAATLDKAVKFSKERGNVPLLCGEFGVYIPNSLQEDRVRWYEAVTKLLDERGIARTSWDYYGGFGVFRTTGGSSFESELNTEVVKAMGFPPPPQVKAEKIRGAFTLFDNFPAARTAALEHWASALNLYHPNNEKYALGWKDADRYGSFMFFFKKEIDWEFLKERNYAVTFSAKTDKSCTFDVRLINREDASSIPWRLNTTVKIEADGKWHTVRIPLTELNEQGAWINASQKWLTPQGKFSWSNIAALVFTAEEKDNHGITILFDAIGLEP